MTNSERRIACQILRCSSTATPEERLWCSVLIRAVADIDQRVIVKNSRWLFSAENRHILDELCDLVDLESEYLLRIMREGNLLPKENAMAA